MIDQGLEKDWQDLCQAVAAEQDPKKLMALVARLVKALDERDRKTQSAPENAKDCGEVPLSSLSEVGQHR